jgi:hypothetical protein
MAEYTLTFDDELLFDEPPPSDAGDEGDSQEHSSIECILLSMCGVDYELNRRASYQQKRRLQNRACAKQSREADRQYIPLVLADINDILKTVEMYVTYVELLKLHGACAELHGDCSEQCYVTCKSNVAQVQKNEILKSLEPSLGNSTKERNREHAKQSRHRKNQFLLDILKERDVSRSTLADVSAHAATLEVSCAVLNDFNDSGDTFMQLTEIRQGLFHRTRTHTENYERLKSRLAYRAVHRLNFK